MFKRLTALFLVLALFFTFGAQLPVEAEAAELIEYSVSHSYGKARLTLTSSSDKNTIYYTTNGKKPTTSSNVYKTIISVSEKTTVRAIEVNKKKKTVASLKLTIEPRASKVNISVEDGAGKSTVKLTTYDSNTKIYYTTDGSKPTSKSKLYTKPFTVKKDCKIRAIAYGTGVKESLVTSRKVKIISLEPEDIYDAMTALKKKYPTGKKWNNDNYYGWNGGIFSGGYGCAGFAFMLSDAAFGSLRARKHKDFDNIRVGDILRIKKDTHSVVVLEIKGDTITVAEGNFNDAVKWGRTFTKSEIKKIGTYVITRYPEK